ncbi:unnamed protein product [Bubo scandiacus]
MALGNFSRVTEFILLGLSETKELQVLFFTFFFLAYAMVLLGNLLIIVTVRTDPKLSSPMYFLLCNLSFIDICCTSVTSPRMLVDLLSQRKAIAFEDCIAQLFFLHLVGASEMFLLTVMAYDRYTAICKPLHYTAIMSRQVCWLLVSACWAGGFLHSIVQTLLTVQLPFCGPNTIDNYFCDVPPVIRLACTDIYVTAELVILTVAGVLGSSAFVVTLVSYIYILSAILCMNSSESRHKAFSTCGSHLTVVCIFYGTTICTYVRPSSTYSPNQDRIVSMLYGILTPLLNPIIYSLRNKEVKSALRRVISRWPCLWLLFWCKG